MVRSTLILALALVLAAPVVARGDEPSAENDGADQPRAEDPKLAATLDDIDRRAAAVADLTGRFRQEKHTALLKKPLVSAGRIRMKGNVVRWDTESPEPSVLHSDGHEIRMHYPKQSVLEVYPIDRRLADLAASPLPRLAALRQHFTIERAPNPSADTPAGGTTRDPAGAIEIRLVPTDPFLAEHVDEVRVTLDVRSAFVTRVQMLDADGDRTVITFSDLRPDTGLQDADLELRPPAGTKISRPLDGAKGGNAK